MWLKKHLVAQSDLGCFESIIKTDEAMGEFGKPFNNELFAKKDYSKELNSGYFIQNDHLKIINCRNIYHQFSIHRDYWKINFGMSAEWHNHWESCCHNWNTSGTDNNVGTSDDFESNGRFRVVFLRWLLLGSRLQFDVNRPFPNSLFQPWDPYFVSQKLARQQRKPWTKTRTSTTLETGKGL